MSERMTCPGCNAHTSDVLNRVMDGLPCPHCGLSSAAVLEVLEARRRNADAEMTRRYEGAAIRADRAERRVRTLEDTLERIRVALDEGGAA